MARQILGVTLTCLLTIGQPAAEQGINQAVKQVEEAIHMTPDIDNGREVYRLCACAVCQHGVKGGFDLEIYSSLQNDRTLCLDVARELLDANFPSSLHEDILQAVGIEAEPSETPGRRKRDPEFRERILRAYGYRCAVCGLDVRLGSVLVGLEAAHIKWHQASGPDSEMNGLALCGLHHKLLDRGVFTLTADSRLVVSEQALGSSGFEDWVLRFHGQSLNRPVRDGFRPRAEYTRWHNREVFQGPARQLGT